MDHAQKVDPRQVATWDHPVDAFTAWLLTWQHFILPALAILAFATLYS